MKNSVGISLLIAVLGFSAPAWAASSADETIADFATRAPETRRYYADYIAGLLRANHPALSGAAMSECLEGVAREPGNGGLKLQGQAIACANIIDR